MSGLFLACTIEAAAVFQPAGSTVGDQMFLAKLGQIYGWWKLV